MVLGALLMVASPASAAHGTESSGCSGFRIVSVPHATDYDILDSVASVSPTDVWAAGLSEDPQTAVSKVLVERWNGRAWRIVSAPDPGTVRNTLTGISAIGAGDIWAVGTRSLDSARSNPHTAGLAEHWTGGAWHVIPTPRSSSHNFTLHAVAAVSRTDVWAAGDDTDLSTGRDHVLVEHWNGTRWRVVAVPRPSGPDNFLTGITAFGRRVWAVGVTSSGTEATAITEFFNGSRWRLLEPGVLSLSGAGTSPIGTTWAVGGTSAGKVVIERWRSGAWHRLAAPTPPGGHGSLVDITSPRSGSIWAAGSDATDRIHPLVETWNGVNWRTVTVQEPASGGDLHGIDAARRGHVWAVGETDVGGNIVRPLVERSCR